MIDPKLSARRKIREWLVLLLRMLFILLVLLVLAHPVWIGTGARGTVAMVVIIDNSGSMSAPSREGRAKLEGTLDAASALISGLDKRDKAAVALLVDDPLVSLPDGLTSDKTALKSALDKIEGTEAAGSVVGAFHRALAMLHAAIATRFEIHVLSDLQNNEWNKTPIDKLSPRMGTLLRIHRIPPVPETAANVSIAAVELPPQRRVAGRRFSAHVRLVNPTAFPATIQLNSLDDQNQKTTQSVSVPPSGEKTAELPLSPESPGCHWVSVWIEGDSFTFDNRAASVYSCSGREHVVFLGQREEFGLLPIALAPTGDGRLSGLEPVFTETDSLAGTLLDKKPLLLVLTWNGLSELCASARQSPVALAPWVEQGGHLLILPSLTEASLSGNLPDWPGAAPEKQEMASEGCPLLVFDPHASMFSDLTDEKGDVALRNIKTFKFTPLQLTQGSHPLLGLTDGRVVMAQRKLGAGSIFTSGLAFDPAWSTLPLKGSFLAIVHSMALSVNHDSTVALVAGDRFQTTDPVPLHLRSLTGTPLDWKGGAEELPAFARAGVYAIQSEKKLTTIGVRASDREGRLQFLSGDRVPVLGGLNYTVKTMSNIKTLTNETTAQRKGMDLYPTLLFLAFLAFMAEGWLANQRAVKK